MKRATLMIFVMLLALPAFGWGERGHRVTGEIAYQTLSSDLQRAVIQILRAHPRFEQDFAVLMPADIAAGDHAVQGAWLMSQAAVWPDHIQGLGDDVRQAYHKSRWHYINLPVWLTEADALALEGQLDHNMSLEYSPPLRQNLNVVQALRGNLQVWHDDSASPADKAVSLCWILHLVGDMHQPLHTVALFSAPYFPSGDRGGNDIQVALTGERKNLHAVWDGLPTGMNDLAPSERTLRTIATDVVDDAAIEEWLYHHASLARKFVYTDDLTSALLAAVSAKRLPMVTVDRDYLVIGESIARRQVNLAGHRIAKLIEVH